MVKTLSIQLAHSLGNKLHSDKDEIDVFAYGLEILLCHLIKFLLLFSLALLFNLLLPTFLVLVAWSGVRIPGGGVHMESYRNCLSFGLLLLLGLAALSTYNIGMSLTILVFGLTSLLALLCIIIWVPAGTDKKQVKRPENRKKQKIETSVFLLLWFSSVTILLALGHSHFALALILGAGGGLYGITPSGYRTFGWLDRSITRLERR